AGTVLSLTRHLLHLLIGNQEARQLVPHNKPQPVVGGEVAFIMCGEVSGGPAIGVVLLYGRVEVAVRASGAAAEAEGIAAPAILTHGVCIGGSETPAAG